MYQCRILAFFFCLTLLAACKPSESKESLPATKPVKDFFVVPGEDEEVDPEIIKRGQVLIAYSDCYQCHKEEDKAKGPSFSDIARRYPMREAYIDMLARKVISGGFGTWGYPVMSAHPKLSVEEAKTMVTYVLSLEGK
jgi:cytochrome c